MFDIKWIRDNPEAFDKGLARRGLDALSSVMLALDDNRRKLLTLAQDIQARRNSAAKAIGAAKAKGEDASDLIEKVSRSKEEQARAEEEAKAASEELNKALSEIPNIPADDVPEGFDESDNREMRKVGEPPCFGFQAKEHFDIGETLGLMDFEGAAKMSGARFVVLSGTLARLERALATFMLDLHTQEFGYTEINPPALVRDDALFGTGQLPKFADDLFCIREFPRDPDSVIEKIKQSAFIAKILSDENNNQNYSGLIEEYNDLASDRRWLIPTAEVPLTNLVAGEILDEAALPKRFAAMTWCFRSEAGSAGKDTRGMIRQHQFSKVELVSIVHPEQSDDELERLVSCAEEVLKRLKLPYRVVTLCSGDMGFSAKKTYDIEVWLPGQDRYREISSCSNCGDFQARRMKARFRAEGAKETRFLHTLNGSGLAIGRTLIAVLENYQRADGSVEIPEALRPYMGGVEAITGD